MEETQEVWHTRANVHSVVDALFVQFTVLCFFFISVASWRELRCGWFCKAASRATGARPGRREMETERATQVWRCLTVGELIHGLQIWILYRLICLPSRAPTLDFWLGITKSRKFLNQGFIQITRF
jgi:hypothetical protein